MEKPMTRVALCGVGNIGKVHLGNLRSLRGCEIAGVYDPKIISKIASGLSDLPIYADADTMFSDPSVDAIVIASPSSSHRELTERALAAGKHTFVEKPVADTLEDAQAIVTAAAKHP